MRVPLAYPHHMDKACDQKQAMTLIPCDRSALERDLVHLACVGTTADLKAQLERLKPKGNLRPVSPSGPSE